MPPDTKMPQRCHKTPFRGAKAEIKGQAAVSSLSPKQLDKAKGHMLHRQSGDAGMGCPALFAFVPQCFKKVDGGLSMLQADKIYILNCMRVLEGTRLFKVARAAATGSIAFYAGDKKEYMLHLQCAFRFRYAEEMAIANLDMFEPTKAMEADASFDWERYNWDVQGFNCYDEWALHWEKDVREAVVEAVEVSSFGDLTIKFSGGLILEVFINNTQSECWRFFQRHAEEHLVVTALGVEQ